MTNIKLLLLLLLNLAIFPSQLNSHGFVENTFIKVVSNNLSGWQLISQIYDHKIAQIRLKSYHPQHLYYSYQACKYAGASQTNCYLRLWFDNSPTHIVECTPSQDFMF